MHLLRRGEVPPDKVQYALEVIERNTAAQVRLIEDILDVSRIVSGKLRLQMHIIDLVKVVNAAAEMLRARGRGSSDHLEHQHSLQERRRPR